MELGKQSIYESSYNAQRLFALARAPKRRDLGLGEILPFEGHDIWNHYEVSWLDTRGKPRVAIAQIVYPCSSENIVESKSLKLYFNTFNNTRVESVDALRKMVEYDLSACVKAPVSVVIQPLQVAMHRILSPMEGTCIDDIDIEIDRFEIDASFLSVGNDTVEETLYSDLLKSNCLVTGQPDWGSVWIRYKGKQICREGLLRYIVSFRDHNEFHEHCVERIFVDLMNRCTPDDLTVGARYTRRGGIDINPVRSTQPASIANPRLIRQ
jgi:7-cyano-7-deazaguanine reductase